MEDKKILKETAEENEAPVYMRRRRSASERVTEGEKAANEKKTDDILADFTDPTPISLSIEISKMFCNHMREITSTDIATSHRSLILNLAYKDGRTQLELARLTHLKPPTVSLSLAKLEDQGYVRREADPNDLRQTRVYLTEKGRALNEVSYEAFRTFENQAISCLNDEESARLLELLTKVRNNIIQTM